MPGRATWRVCATPRKGRKPRSRPWVLDTGTKGTGAEMVPLEKVLKSPAPDGGRRFVAPRPRPEPAPAPSPRAPRRFKVVDVMSGRVLVEDVEARDALRAFEGVGNVRDVRVYVWQPRARKWRLLNVGEQKALWEQRAT